MCWDFLRLANRRPAVALVRSCDAVNGGQVLALPLLCRLELPHRVLEAEVVERGVGVVRLLVFGGRGGRRVEGVETVTPEALLPRGRADFGFRLSSHLLCRR